MAILLTGTTIGGHSAIHAGNLATHGIVTTSNIGSYAITSIPTSFSSITVTSSFDTASNDIYASMRVIRNNSASNADGMYIGYGNSGSGITRIFGGGATGGALEKYATYTVEPGSFRAPIFYDSADTTYYLDPNSTTSLRTVGSWRSDSSSWDGEYSGKIQYHSNHWYFQSGNLWIFRNAGGSNVFQVDQSGNGTFNGDIYLGTRATWLSSYLNQDVRTSASPSFSTVNLNTLNASDTNARYYVQSTNGVPSNNLGNPTVTEMALFDEQFNNKTAFYDNTALSFWTSSDGTNYTEYTGFDTTAKKRFLGGDSDSGVYIPNLTNRFRIELENTQGYVFLNQLYIYWSSNSHSTKVHIWVRRCDNNQWYQWTDSNTQVSSWPGHLYLPFGGIPFYPGALASNGHYNRIRIEFIPSWSSGTYSYTNINLMRMQIWGGYPAGKRNIYSVDENRNVTFPTEVGATAFYATDFRAANAFYLNGTSYYLNSYNGGIYTNARFETAGNLVVQGNSYLGNGNGDEVHINDILRVGATDSGDAHFYFGEGGSAGSDYGSHWYWDSGYRFTWYTRNAGTDSTLFYYDTNSLSYITWGRSISMNTNSIDYTGQLHFSGGTRFQSNDTHYLNFKTDATDYGSIQVRDGNNTLKGYLGYYDASGFGLLNSTGNWGIRFNPGNVGTDLFYAGDWKLNTRSGGVGVNGNLYTDQNYGYGLVGVYSSTRYQGVFAMSNDYKLLADGTGTGNLYGIAWTHTNVGGQSKSGLGHQALFMDNGTTQTAIGSGIWTAGLITTTSYGTSANWKSAYDWGNHASAGYLTGITSGQVTGALGYTPYNSSNPNGYITSSSLSSYLPLAGGTMTGKIFAPSFGSDAYGGAFEVRERGYVSNAQSDWSYSPAISFHWGNRHVQRFGVRADGLFAIDDAPIALRSWVSAQGFITGYTETDTLNSVTSRGNTTSNSVRFGTHVDLSPTGSAFRFYDGTTFRGGLGLDSWGHSGSDANLVLYVNGDNNLFISTSGIKRAQFNSGAAIFRTYSADNAYNIRMTGGDQFNAYYNDSVATLYLQYHNGNGGTLNVGNGKLTVNTAGSVVASGDMRAPIFYDSNDTNYYVDPNSLSRLGTMQIDRIGVGQAVDNGYRIITSGDIYLNANGNGWAEGVWKQRRGGSTYYDVIDSGNIGSQSVNYATTAGALSSMNISQFTNNSGYLTSLPSHNHDDRYYTETESDGRYAYKAGAAGQDFSVDKLSSYYLRNHYGVSTNHSYGMYFDNDLSTAYGIFRESGAWDHPYPDLRIAFHTGIKLGANSSYQGIRFYTDYDMVTQVMSVNNGSDPLGAGNVYVNNALQAGGSLRAPVFYDSDDTTYYLDPNGTSNLSRVLIPNALSGASLIVGINDTSRVYNDDARKGLVINANYYPHLYLNALSNNNATHGAVISMTGTLTAGGYRRWGMGIANQDPSNFSIGYVDNNSNPHYGVGGSGWSQFWIDTSGHTFATGSFRAPIFYDSQNTDYYVDPNSTSRINSTIIYGGTGGTSPRLTFMTTDDGDTNKYIGMVSYWTQIGCHVNEGLRLINSNGVEQFYVRGGTSGNEAWFRGNVTASGILYASGGNSSNWNTAYSWGNHASAGYLTSITSGNVTTALGYTPYNATNPNGYITGISFANVSSKPTTISGYGITDAITTANIGSQSVSYAATAGSAPNGSNSNQFYDVNAGVGNGLRFWNGSSAYKISMGVGALYQYGPVSDYSIKMQMNDGDTGRGFTWGRESYAPIAALNSTSGDMEVAGYYKSYGYRGNGNVGGTGSASWHPDGIYCGSTMWQYGAQYKNNTGIYGVSEIQLNAGLYLQTYNDRNLIVKGNSSSDAGIEGRNAAGNNVFQIYGSGSDYGFLNGTWAGWDIRKTKNAAMYMNNDSTYYLQTNSTSNFYALNIQGNAVVHAGNIGSQSVSYATTAGTANAVAWTNVSSRPTALSQFTNDLGNYGGFLTSITAHSHAISDVTGLQTALDGKQASLGFTPYNSTNPSGYITSSGSISGSAGSVSGLTLTSSANGINPDSVTQNQIGYNTSVSLFGQSDGGLYSSAYSSSWIHQIYGDFRTGQIAIRGKNSGSWQAWRTVLDSSNYTSYAPGLTGSGASGTWGINVTGSAGSVAWTNVSSRPTNLSQFTNDLGNYGGWQSASTAITTSNIGSQSVSYASTAGSAPANGGNSSTVGGYAPSGSVGANTVVIRDANNYIYAHYINSNVSESENPTINSFYTSNGDGWLRKSSVAHVKSQLGLGSMAYESSGTYQTVSGAINTGNIGSQSVSYATTSQQLTKFGDIYGQDWNSYYINGKMIVSSVYGGSGPNFPTGAYNYGAMLSYGVTGSDFFQVYFPENGALQGGAFRKLHYRTGWNGSWSAWKSVVDQEGQVCTIAGSNQTGIEIHSNVGYNQDPLTYFLMRGQADTSWKALKVRLTGDAGGQDIEFRRIAENGTDARMWYVPRGANTVNFDYPIVQPSDSRLKDNITPISTPVDKIKSLRGVEFDWNSGEQVGTHDVGLIAQDVEAVLPEAVTTQEDGYKNLAYAKVIPLLVEAMKEQQAMIEALKAEIELLKNK